MDDIERERKPGIYESGGGKEVVVQEVTKNKGLDRDVEDFF